MLDLLHTLFPGQCVRRAVWHNGVFRCPCGRVVAMRYRFGGRIEVYVTPRFQSAREKILRKSALLPPEMAGGAVNFDDIPEERYGGQVPASFEELRSLPPLAVRPLEEEEAEPSSEEDT